MAIPNEVQELVERFDRNREAYRSTRYKETRLRREFVDPFFVALGWDVENKQGFAEAYKDVVHEDAVKVGGATKAPDYCFRIGGTRKFFVEAKKPAVSIKTDISPAYQLRRYAWSAKLPLSILTDFEEFAVYDCRVKPSPGDKPSAGRTMYLEYRDYAKRWDKIASIFARDAILMGSFDKYAEKKRKRGTAEVDAAFLQDIEAWRQELARGIALRNPKLTTREINFAVQRTIDRIIFLRICEDRGIEEHGRLMALRNGTQVYKRLFRLFQEADERYNSGLFHFQKERGRPEGPDELTPRLTVDDKLLKTIIKGLYYPDSPYEFSVLPADILGQVYEQFLGKVIRLTEGHRAKVEDKPEVKKAGGVYYTPTYIVDYIVENTVGKLLEKSTPVKAAKLRILDPACGSGSFLIGAYQYLLDWHRQYYEEHDPKRWARSGPPRVYEAAHGEWRLTTEERKRILLKSIYGVDIDPQAVEVTKLSLLLKVLEGQSRHTLDAQLRWTHERALPDLASNIKCGNSLIGPDFYEGKQIALLDDEERYRINVFDWRKEFPDIMRAGGFHAVIGNPPYGYLMSTPEQEYFTARYQHQDYQKDFYLLFLERYEYLLRHTGLLGVIVSNTWLQSVRLRKIRKHLSSSYRWRRVLLLPEKVFGAVVDTHVLVFEKAGADTGKTGMLQVDIRRGGDVKASHELALQDIPRSGSPINVAASMEAQKLYKKIRDGSVQLQTLCKVYNGIKPFERGKGTPPQTAQVLKEKPYVKEGPAPDPSWRPLLRGSLIGRYVTLWNHDYWVQYGPRLAAPRDPRIFDAEVKIMFRQTADSIIATLVESGFVARNNMHILLSSNPAYDLRYVLGIMNSTLMDFAYTVMNPEKGEALAEVKKHHVETLPIREIDFANPDDRALHDRMVNLVGSLLDLQKKRAKLKTAHDKELLQREIEATDRRIDQLVYKLYGLMDDEIKIVEQDKGP